MSTQHAGNFQNEILREEHDGDINAKRISLASAATIYAVVNTSAGGVQNSMVTLFSGPNQIGSVTVSNPINLNSNVTLNASPNYIGLMTIANRLDLNSNITLNSSVNNIGFATVNNAAGAAYIGLVSVNIGGSLPALSAGANAIGLVTIANKIDLNSNVTLNASPNYIGLTTAIIGGGALASVATIYAVVNTAAQSQGMVTIFPGPNQIGSVTVSNPVNLNSNITLNSSANYIGLATVDIGTNNIIKLNSVVTLSPSVNSIGFATVQNATAWPDPKTYIGLVTAFQANQPALVAGAAYVGLVTIDIGTNNNVAIKGNITLSDSKGFIGLTTTTLGASPALIGIVTIANSNVRAITGNVTLSDAKTYIGLVTSTLGASTAGIGFATIAQSFPGGATVFTQIISATGNTTIFVAPASNLFFIKNLHVSSLGRAEVEFRSGATTLIPFTSLSTTAGFAAYYGEYGLPARAQADGFVANLNGAATIAVMANVRFGV